MSCQKGNGNRSRAQKYQNTHAFKNTLHDTSHRTKFINNIQVVNVCERCKKIIEWKIKYKKYKPLKAPSKCTKCNEKSVKHAYHIMCGPCASKHQVCPKCGEKAAIIKPEVKEEALQLDRELRLLLKKLPERKRRTFLRYMNRESASKIEPGRADDSNNEATSSDEDYCDLEPEKTSTAKNTLTRDDLLNKLKSLMIAKTNDEDDDNDDDELHSSNDEYSDYDRCSETDSDDKSDVKKI